MQILLVEPESDSPVQWRRRLQILAADIVVAASNAEALSMSARTDFTLVFYHWHPVANSSESRTLVRQLKSRTAYLVCVVDNEGTTNIDPEFACSFDDIVSNVCSDDVIAAKVRHAAELVILHQRLAQAQKLESIGELAAGIAHEINTPIQYVGDNTRFVQDACGDLTEILQCCQSLINCVDSGIGVSTATQRLREKMTAADVTYLLEEIPSAITQTLEGVDRVANIVRAMKEFAHPGTSEMTLTDLSGSINNTVMVARNEWKYVAELETHFDAELPLVPCLPGEINQVLLNMIVNAAQAIADAFGDSPEKKGRISINTRLMTPHAEIRISDNGTGISATNLQRIFTPFFTTKAAGKGTGQGLAIANSVIVEKHGGTISVESEVGRGTTFVIRLPLENARLNRNGSTRSNEFATK